MLLLKFNDKKSIHVVAVEISALEKICGTTSFGGSGMTIFLSVFFFFFAPLFVNLLRYDFDGFSSESTLKVIFY
jgi:hypothetical protein